MNKSKIERKKLIDDLKRVYDEIGRPPNREIYNKIGEYSSNTYIRNWGSWRNALLEIIGVANKTNEKLIKEIECVVCKNKFMQKDWKQKCCSKKCSLDYVNKINPINQRTKTKKCKTCENLIFSSRTYCKKCFSEKQIILQSKIPERTLEEVKIKSGPGMYQNVRHNAQKLVKLANWERKCYICGYDKHVEVCHKKQISSFPPETKIKEINNLENLILLCPTHHWELDHKMLKL